MEQTDMDDVTPAPERWLPAVGYEGFYEVSDLGRVRSVRHLTPEGLRIRKPQAVGAGYLSLKLSVRGKITTEYVHRMVAAAFIGPCPEDQEVCHRDDDKANNSLVNLEYGTHAENQRQARERGRMASGERNGTSVLTEELVAEIRSASAAGVQGVTLARFHGVSKATICRVIRGNLWRTPSSSSPNAQAPVGRGVPA